MRGLCVVWERACALGLEAALEEQLRKDEDGGLAELLGELGNELARTHGSLAEAAPVSPYVGAGIHHLTQTRAAERQDDKGRPGSPRYRGIAGQGLRRL